MNDQQILEIFAKLVSPSYYGKGKKRGTMRLKWCIGAALTNPLFGELESAGIRVQRIDNGRTRAVNIWLPLERYEELKRLSGGKIKWMKEEKKIKERSVCEDYLFVNGSLDIATAYMSAIYRVKFKHNKNKALRELEWIAGSSDEFDGKIGQLIYRSIIEMINKSHELRLGLKRKGLIKS